MMIMYNKKPDACDFAINNSELIRLSKYAKSVTNKYCPLVWVISRNMLSNGGYRFDIHLYSWLSSSPILVNTFSDGLSALLFLRNYPEFPLLSYADVKHFDDFDL